MEASKKLIRFMTVWTPYNLVLANSSEEHVASSLFIPSLVMEAVYSYDASITLSRLHVLKPRIPQCEHNSRFKPLHDLYPH